jgi:hypothetical protein
MPRARCKECDELVGAIITATCKVLEAQLKLAAAQERKIGARKYVAACCKARVEERHALASLAGNQQDSGCVVGHQRNLRYCAEGPRELQGKYGNGRCGDGAAAHIQGPRSGVPYID